MMLVHRYGYIHRGGSREVVAGGAEIQYMPGSRGRIGPCGVQGQRPGGGSRGAKPPGKF